MQPVYEKAGWKNTARRCLRLPPLWHCCQTVTWRLRTEQCLTLNECMFYKIISCTAVSVWPTAPMLPPQQIRLYCISRSFGWRRASQQNQLCFVHKSSFVIQIQLGLGVAWFPNGHWVLMWLTSLKPFLNPGWEEDWSLVCAAVIWTILGPKEWRLSSVDEDFSCFASPVVIQ